MGTDYTAYASCELAYLMDESSGNLADASSHGRTGIAHTTGTILYSQVGKFGTAIHLDGNSYFDTGLPPSSMITGNCTIVFFQNSDDASSNQKMFYSSHDGTGDRFYYRHDNGAANSTKLGLSSWNPIFTTSYVAGTYQHVAVKISGTTGYVLADGSQIGTQGSLTVSIPTTPNLNIGRNPVSNNLYWNGYMDEFAVFSAPLSSTEINDIKDNGLKQTASVTVALTGTVTSSITEADIVTGGKTIILTLTGDTWVASGGTFDAQRQNIINGIDSAQAEGTGWDAVVKAGLAVTDVVRTSDTVVTITLDAFATYDITATETITATVPATALVGNSAIVASPTFTVSATVTAAHFMTTNSKYW